MTFKGWLRNRMGDRRVRRVKAIRTHTACRLDVGPWRRPGLDGLDCRLAEAVGHYTCGTFLEVGGNDGLQQSNSFLLERELGWTGILIEGLPELAAEAVRNRPKATVVCAAVTDKASFGVVGMQDRDLTTAISDSPGRLYVATTTLSTVIDAVSNGKAPDLISIDVEGHELEVLRGLDLTRHSPPWILVETGKIGAVTVALRGYKLVAQLSHHDYLFQRTAS